jgi:hypothetical protein
MAIGDDLMVMLGLVPARDRAGIARGTMADEAKASVAANGARPPAFTMPAGMLAGGERPPPADVELPDDVATSYAAGKSKASSGPSIIPQVIPPAAPQERVIASGPAAAPPPEVKVRNSEIMLKHIERQAQMKRMQQIIGSIGMIANGAFNRNPDSQARTSASLAGMAGGGGGADDLGTLKDLLAMRAKEDDDERIVQHGMRTQGLTRADAMALHAQGQLAGRNTVDALTGAEKIREKARILRSIEPHLADYAAAAGMDETAYRAIAKDDPQKAIDLVKPGALETVRTQREENAKREYDRKAFEHSVAGAKAAADERGDPSLVTSADLSPTAVQHRLNEEQLARAKAEPGAASQVFTKFLEGPHKTAQGARDYLENTGKRLGDTWDPKLMTGTLSELRRSVVRGFETFGASGLISQFPGMDIAKLRGTAAYESALNAYVTDRVKMLPGAASDKEGLFAKAIAGNATLEPGELREVVRMNELAHRQDLVSHDRQVRDIKDKGGHVERQFNTLPTFTERMPEPSKILKDDLYAPGNAPLRNAMAAAAAQREQTPRSSPDYPDTVKEYRRVKGIFDRELGPEMSTYFLAHPDRGK